MFKTKTKNTKKNITTKNMKLRNVPKFHHITVCPYEEKEYWKQKISEIEQKHKNQSEIHIKSFNFSKILPKRLYDRVTKLMSLASVESEIFPTYVNNKKNEIKLKESQNSSECSTESELSQTEESITITTTKFTDSSETKLSLEDKVQKCETKNWIKNYALENDIMKRIKWKTKYYDLQEAKRNRPLIEKAEEVMDQASENFAKFVNSLGSDKTTDITKDMIKSLFVINIDNKNEEKDAAVVESANISRQLSELIEEDTEFIEFQKMKKIGHKKHHKTPPKVAFGRTNKISKTTEYYFPLKDDHLLDEKIYFSKELRTGEIIFSGICNLKVTKDLIQYYTEHEELKRPEYLVKNGFFNQLPDSTKRRTSIIPFYELIKK